MLVPTCGRFIGAQQLDLGRPVRIVPAWLSRQDFSDVFQAVCGIVIAEDWLVGIVPSELDN